MKKDKKWIIIVILNLFFYVGFFLGFLFGKKDSIISQVELYFILFTIPFSIFYGILSYKLLNQVFLPNILYSVLMLPFTAWLMNYDHQSLNPKLGLIFCLISLISSFITLSVTKSTQKQNEEFEDK